MLTKLFLYTCVISWTFSVSLTRWSCEFLYTNSSWRSWPGEESPFSSVVLLLPLASVVKVILETFGFCFGLNIGYLIQHLARSDDTARRKSFLRNVYSIGLNRLVPNLKKSRISANVSGRIAPGPNSTWNNVIYHDNQHTVKIPNINANIISARFSEAIERFRGSAENSACLRMFRTCLRMTRNIRQKQNVITHSGMTKKMTRPVMS